MPVFIEQTRQLRICECFIILNTSSKQHLLYYKNLNLKGYELAWVPVGRADS